MLERGYLWSVPWRAGPHMLFEQYFVLLVLSPACKNKGKKKPQQIKIDRCCPVRQSKGRRSSAHQVLAYLAGMTWKVKVTCRLSHPAFMLDCCSCTNRFHCDLHPGKLENNQAQPWEINRKSHSKLLCHFSMMVTLTA